MLLKSLAITRAVDMMHFKFRNSRHRLGSKLRSEDKITVGLWEYPVKVEPGLDRVLCRTWHEGVDFPGLSTENSILPTFKTTVCVVHDIICEITLHATCWKFRNLRVHGLKYVHL